MCLNYFLPQSIGGTEVYILRLVQYLNKINIETVILIPHFNYSISDEYEYEGIKIIRYAENSAEDRQMIMRKKKPDGLNEFARILMSEKPDMIHFHDLAPGRGINIFHVEKAYELNIPVVLTFHLSYYTCLKGSLIYKGKEKCDGVINIKKCTECVYHSKGIAGIKAGLLNNTSMTLFNLGVNLTGLNSTVSTALGFPFVIDTIKTDLLRLSNFAKKIVVLAGWYKVILEKNGVPSSKLISIKQGITSKPQVPGKHDKISFPLKLVYVGRISALKGLHLLIDAVQKIPVDKISLYIYGPEAEEAYAIECRQKSKGNRNIYWNGTIHSEDVIQTISNFDVLCLPSAFEMSPLVIQEAFAAGLPVIASDVYGNAEQIKHGVNGWLFRFNDSMDLRCRLDALINDLNSVEDARPNLQIMNTFKDVALEHKSMYLEILSNQN